MASFRVTTHIDAPPERVWALLEDWEGSAAWMVDATTVQVLGAQRTGAGTRVRAVTRIAGAPLVDEMEVTQWEPPRLLRVRHERFPILGDAWFALTPDAGGTRLEWVEELKVPLGLLGEGGARVLREPIQRVLRASLARLKRLVERMPDASRSVPETASDPS